MSTPAQGPATGLDLAALDAITDAVESGAGLPEVVRAAARALDASLALTDRAGAVLAVAARSPADERALLDDADGVDEHRAARRRRRRSARCACARAASPSSAPGASSCTTLIASEVERVRAPERASEPAPRDFLRALLDRELTGREDIARRAGELGLDLARAPA